jgi:predicted regulator of Ras-like GTPase activity (Roadblock/LC7/MglB family)
MTETQTALDRVTRVPGVRGALVIAATDGRTAESAGLHRPRLLHLRGDGGSVLAAPGPDDLVLVAVVGPDANLGLTRLELLEAAGRLG